MRRALCVALTLALALPAWAQAPAGVTDAEVLKGIKQVDDADYDAGIFTLDAAARRLASDPKHASDLSQAYLYLGIAYMGKGHEAAARAKFREAVGQIKDISLSPDRFPPKVIDALEAAREEVKKGSTTAASASPPAQKKGGSGKTILIIGGLAAVGGGVAAAAGGGGSKTPAGPTDTRRTQTFTGNLCGYPVAGNGCEAVRGFDIVVSASGTLDAEITWGNPSLFFAIYLDDENFQTIAQSNRVSNTLSRLSHPVSPRTSGPNAAYHVYVEMNSDGTSDNFTLTVRHP